MYKIYATVGDTVSSKVNPKSKETEHFTVEGETVVKDIEVDKDTFQAKSNAIKELWPTAVIRYMR